MALKSHGMPVALKRRRVNMAPTAVRTRRSEGMRSSLPLNAGRPGLGLAQVYVMLVPGRLRNIASCRNSEWLRQEEGDLQFLPISEKAGRGFKEVIDRSLTSGPLK